MKPTSPTGPHERRQLNRKVLGLALAVAVVLGPAVVGLHALQQRRNARVLIRQSESAETLGQLDRAERYLKLYLGYVPDDIDALARYGLVLEKGAQSPTAKARAVAVFERVLAREPGRDAIRTRLVRDAMDLGQFDDAQEHLKILLAGAPNDGGLEELLGECRERLGEYAEAADWYEKAGKHAPESPESYSRLALLARTRLGDAARGDAAMDRLVASNGGSAAAYLARGRYRLRYRIAGADDDIGRARALAPDDIEVLLATAEVERTAGHLDAGRAILERGIARAPGDARMYQTLADLESQANRPAAAASALERGIKATPDRPDIRYGLADAEIRAAQFDRAAATVVALRAKPIAPELLDFLDARILVGRGRWREARPALERVAPLLSTRPELAKQAQLLLGLCHERTGDSDLQLDAARRAVEFDPHWIPARLAVASALRALGRNDEALAEYRALAPESPEARLAVAQLLVVQALRQPEPERRWRDAEAALDAAEADGPVAVALLRAESEMAQGHPDRAAARLEAVQAAHPEAVAPRIGLAALARRRGDPAAALALLDRARRECGDSVEIRLALARERTARANDPAQALAALADLARDLKGFSGEDQARLLDGLAEMARQRGDVTEARRLWELSAATDPESLRARVGLFDLALLAGDEPALARSALSIRAAEGPGGVLGDYAEATLQISRARRGDLSGLAAARSHLAAIARRRPSWGRPFAMQGAVAELQGDPAAAIDAYLKALDLGERDALTVRRAVQLLYARHRYADADRALRALQAQSPIAGDLSRIAAEVALRTHDPDRALGLARQSVPADSKDYRDHLWLGQILAASGKADEAEKELRRAVALGGEAPEVWIALVRHLARGGHADKAEAAIVEARAKLPAARAPLALALCDEAVGRRDRAEAHFREALAASPDDPATLRAVAAFRLGSGAFARAEPDLRRLLDPAVRADEADRAWARRNLALGLAGGDERHYQEALALVEQNLKAGGLDEDRRAKVLLMALRPEHRRESIRELEGLIGKETPGPEEQFLLAQLFEAEHDWPKARLKLLNLLGAGPKDPRHLAYFTRALLRHGELDEARTWLGALEKADPRAYVAAELKARLLAAEGHADRAEAVLTDAAQAPGAPRAAVAGLLEELGRYDAAEATFRALAAGPPQPAATLALAQYLGRRHRTAEALDLCDTVRASSPPATVLAVALAILSASPPDAVQSGRVAGWLDRANRDHPDRAPLRSLEASLRIVQARYDDAEAIYGRMLATDARDVGALNNLAWLRSVRDGRHDEALALIGRAIDAAGPLPSLLDTRGLVELALGQSDAAVRDLGEAVAQRPTATYYFHLARAQLGAQNRAAAAEMLRKARAAGLTPGLLHPLERASLDRVARELDEATGRTPAREVTDRDARRP